MNPPIPFSNPIAMDFATQFAMRPVSQTSEQFVITDGSQRFVWAWFKPGYTPQGLVIRIPDESWKVESSFVELTLRCLLQAVGIDPAYVAVWQLYGMTYQSWNGANPLLDQPIPAPGPGVIAEVVVFVNVPQIPLAFAIPQSFVPQMNSFVSVPGRDLTPIFERIDAEWNAAMDVEKDLDRLRKNMVDLTGRLKSLNRDLSSDERLYSSREDIQDWTDARRMLRDSEQRLRGCIKDFDIGDSSSAGYRRGYEQIHRQFIIPKIPFKGIEQQVEQFIFYRKLVTTVAGQNEQRVLERSQQRRAACPTSHRPHCRKSPRGTNS